MKEVYIIWSHELTGVELPQMTVYMKFSDRVHLFFDRVHFFVRIVSYVFYARIGKVFSKKLEFFPHFSPRAAGRRRMPTA